MSARQIQCCPKLRVIDLQITRSLAPADFLLIARGCPVLNHFCVLFTDWQKPEFSSHDFSQLMQALPQVELLELEVVCQLTASNLEEIANFCPRLKYLSLACSDLYIPTASLAKVPPLSELGTLHLGSIRFKYPWYHLQSETLQSIATQWSRIFPQVRCPQCSQEEDRLASPLGDEDPPTNQESDEDDQDRGTYSGNETYSNGPASDSASDLLHFGTGDAPDDRSLRTRLWKLLRYVEDPLNIGLEDRYMLRSNLEIEILGWPIIRREAFALMTNRSLVD